MKNDNNKKRRVGGWEGCQGGVCVCVGGCYQKHNYNFTQDPKTEKHREKKEKEKKKKKKELLIRTKHN